MAFPGGKMTVQHSHQCLERPCAKTRLETLNRLRRERNFRHQHNRPFPLLQRMRNRLQIHLCLPTPRHAV